MCNERIQKLLQKEKRPMIDFQSNADDMKRIIEYSKKKPTESIKASSCGSISSLQELRKVYAQEHRYELKVDGVSAVFDGSLEKAQDKLREMSF